MRTLIFVAASLLSTSVWAADSCPPAPQPVVEVVTPVVEIAFAAVPNVVAYAPFPKAMETSLGPGWTINGLTVVRPLVKTQLQTGDAQTGDGTCAWITKATINFSFFEPAHIYVSDKYKPGSCEFEAIRNHEHQHVGIHLNTRLKHAPRLKARVERALAEVKARPHPDPTMALAAYQSAISEAVDEGIRDFQRETGALNSIIDSTESYLKLQSRCQNW